MGSFSLLQGIFPTQGSNPGLLHYRLILYHLSHKRSTIWEWVAYPFSNISFQPRSWTRVSCIAGGFLTNWAFYCPSQVSHFFLSFFYKLKVCGNLYLASLLASLLQHHLPTLWSLCHILLTVKIFQNFPLLHVCFGYLWRVNFDITVGSGFFFCFVL